MSSNRSSATSRKLSISLAAVIFLLAIFSLNRVTLAQADEDCDRLPIRNVTGLTSITFWESSSGVPTPHTFATNDPKLTMRRTDRLGLSNNFDFEGVAGAEFYDVFYSDGNGAPNPNGQFVTIEAVWPAGASYGGGLNIGRVDFNGTGQFANSVASFVALGDNAASNEVGNAVEEVTNAANAMGNTVGHSRRLRMTVGFPCVCCPPTGGLVDWWPFDETSFPIWQDIPAPVNNLQEDLNRLGPGLDEVSAALCFDDSCSLSGTDSNFGGGGGTAAPRIYPVPNSTEILIALGGGTLLKFKSAGGTGRNLFAIRNVGGTFLDSNCPEAYLLGSQKFPAEIRDVDFIDGYSLVALADGRIVKINSTGGTGQNMFAINVAPQGFTGAQGFSYYVGSHKFSSGIADVTAVGNETIVSFDDGRILKVKGTGGGGFNLFAVIDHGNSYSSATNFQYYIGDQALQSPVTTVASIDGTLFVATKNGKVLKVTGSGGGGHNMFGVTLTSNGYNRSIPYLYYVGDQRFSAPVTRILSAGSETIIALTDGRILKIKNTGGGGHNMFAVHDNGGSFSPVSGYDYYRGDQKLNTYVTSMAFISGQLLVGFANGKMLKVTGTGGGGHNMFAIQETTNGFSTVSPFTYLVGSTNFGSPVSEIVAFGGFTWVGVGNGKLLKLNGTGGSGFNMFAVSQNQTDFSSLCGYPYLAGSQGFK